MSSPHDPQATREHALLMRAFQTEADLSPAQIDFLRERGFLQDPEGYDFGGHDEYEYWNDFGWYDPVDEDLDHLDAAGEAGGRPIRRGQSSRPNRNGGVWTLDQLGDHLTSLFEQHRDTLLILMHLAPESDSFGDALIHLNRPPEEHLVERIEQGYSTETLSFHALWDVLALDVFRQPLPARDGQSPVGPVVQAYAALVQASAYNQLPGKYAWILRRDAVALVPRLFAVQRRLLRASACLFREQPAHVSRALRRNPQRSGLLAHLLLHNSRVPGHPSRDWASPEEPFLSIPPSDHAPAYRRAWTLAVQMDADLILPYLVDSLHGSETSSGLRCPRGWNELGYRVREQAP